VLLIFYMVANNIDLYRGVTPIALSTMFQSLSVLIPSYNQITDPNLSSWQNAMQPVSSASLETDLLTKSNRPFNSTLHPRLNLLIQKRDAEKLTPDEHQELIQLTQQVEVLNVERITHLSTLAKLRKTTLPQLIKDLQLTPIGYV
jgi:hypothetical protein